MSVDTIQDAIASTVLPIQTPEPLSGHDCETVRVLLLGTLTSVQLTIHTLHQKQYAEPNDWSRLLPTGRPNEVMAILTKRVVITSGE